MHPRLILQKWRRYFARSWSDIFLILEAAIWLGLARLFIRTMPFRWIVPWLNRHPDRPFADRDFVARVASSVLIASRNVPWNAVCLPQALAAKAMLRLRGQGAALHLGAALAGGDLTAHAWLECDGVIVTGEEGVAGMAPLARYG